MGNLLSLENTLLGKIRQERQVPKILIYMKKISIEKAKSFLCEVHMHLGIGVSVKTKMGEVTK